MCVCELCLCGLEPCWGELPLSGRDHVGHGVHQRKSDETGTGAVPGNGSCSVQHIHNLQTNNKGHIESGIGESEKPRTTDKWRDGSNMTKKKNYHLEKQSF